MFFLIFIFGLIIGNFATTLLYRLPRNISIIGFSEENSKPPFCSICYHDLKFYEYLPVLGWISTRGKCNYCSSKIDLAYFYLELLCACFAIICAYLHNDNIDIFFLKFCFCVTSALQVAIYSLHRQVSLNLSIALITEAILFRTLHDDSILTWLIFFSFSGLLSILLFQKFKNKQFAKELIQIII